MKSPNTGLGLRLPISDALCRLINHLDCFSCKFGCPIPLQPSLGLLGTEPPSLTSTVFSRFCGVAREKFFAFNKEFARFENSDE